VEVPRVQKITGEFIVLKEGVEAEHAEVEAERQEDARLVEAETTKLNAKVAQQEEQVRRGIPYCVGNDVLYFLPYCLREMIYSLRMCPGLK
jgi:hypothetical protein